MPLALCSLHLTSILSIGKNRQGCTAAAQNKRGLVMIPQLSFPQALEQEFSTRLSGNLLRVINGALVELLGIIAKELPNVLNSPICVVAWRRSPTAPAESTSVCSRLIQRWRRWSRSSVSSIIPLATSIFKGFVVCYDQVDLIFFPLDPFINPIFGSCIFWACKWLGMFNVLSQKIPHASVDGVRVKGWTHTCCNELCNMAPRAKLMFPETWVAGMDVWRWAGEGCWL